MFKDQLGRLEVRGEKSHIRAWLQNLPPCPEPQWVATLSSEFHSDIDLVTCVSKESAKMPPEEKRSEGLSREQVVNAHAFIARARAVMNKSL